MPIEILQISPMLDEMNDVLAQRYTVHRHDAGEAPEGVLAAIAPSIRALVTGGHLGASRALMVTLPNLEIVAIHGVGYNKVDMDHVKARGIRVTGSELVIDGGYVAR